MLLMTIGALGYSQPLHNFLRHARCTGFSLTTKEDLAGRLAAFFAQTQN